MDWIVEALHQSHADEKRFREDAIIRLQEEQSKIQNRLDRLYDDRLDGFIEPDFFERKSREWRQTQKRFADQITDYQEAANDYVQDGIRLLELSKKAYFLYKQQDSSEKRKLLNFVCSNSMWKDHTLTATFRQPLIDLQLRTQLGKEKGRRNSFQRPSSYLAPHSGQSSQLFLETTHGDAQLLSKIARSALVPQAIHISHRVAIRLPRVDNLRTLVSDANDMQPVVSLRPGGAPKLMM